MKIDNIDEAESLIAKFRRVVSAKKEIERIEGEDGGSPDDFILTDKDTGLDICLFGLKSESLDAIRSVINDQYDKITARLERI